MTSLSDETHRFDRSPLPTLRREQRYTALSLQRDLDRNHALDILYRRLLKFLHADSANEVALHCHYAELEDVVLLTASQHARGKSLCRSG